MWWNVEEKLTTAKWMMDALVEIVLKLLSNAYPGHYMHHTSKKKTQQKIIISHILYFHTLMECTSALSKRPLISMLMEGGNDRWNWCAYSYQVKNSAQNFYDLRLYHFFLCACQRQINSTIFLISLKKWKTIFITFSKGKLTLVSFINVMSHVSIKYLEQTWSFPSRQQVCLHLISYHSTFNFIHARIMTIWFSRDIFFFRDYLNRWNQKEKKLLKHHSTPWMNTAVKK